MSNLTSAQHILYNMKYDYQEFEMSENDIENLKSACNKIISESSHHDRHNEIHESVHTIQDSIDSNLTGEEIAEKRDELWDLSVSLRPDRFEFKSTLIKEKRKDYTGYY